MTQVERIKSSREKRYFLYFRNVKRPFVKLVIADKPVYVLKHGSAVVEVKIGFTAVFLQNEYFLSAPAEYVVFFL